jgi:hypothetical protein
MWLIPEWARISQGGAKPISNPKYAQEAFVLRLKKVLDWINLPFLRFAGSYPG